MRVGAYVSHRRRKTDRDTRRDRHTEGEAKTEGTIETLHAMCCPFLRPAMLGLVSLSSVYAS